MDALRRYGLPLLAKILALARATSSEKIIKTAVPTVKPMELAAQPLYPAGTLQQRIITVLIEQQVYPRDQTALQGLIQRLQNELLAGLTTAQ